MAELSDRFEQALVFATQLHSTQTRKASGVPYVAHLLGVAAIVLEYGATEDEVIAALCHDAIEDQGGAATREEIRRRFGPVVADIVEGCTETDAWPKPPWCARKEEHLQHLRQATPSVRLVVAADKLYNASSILKDCRRMGDAVWDRFSGGKEGTLWYYRAAIGALEESGPHPLLDELVRVVSVLERLAAGE